MFGLLGALAFGVVAYGAWASSSNRSSKYHSDAVNSGANFYLDDKGIMRHMNGRKYTAEELRQKDHLDRRAQLHHLYNAFVEKCKIDTEWYTFEDYVINRFRNDHVTGKEIFPEIDWDNVPTDNKKMKPLNRPPKYLYFVPNEKGSCTDRVFRNEKDAAEYAINTFGYNPKTERPWFIPILIEEKYVYQGTTGIGTPARYIMDDTGEVFEKERS